MNLKRLIGLTLIGLLVYVGFQAIQVGIAYVQVKNIVETQALEARRDDMSEEEVRAAIVSHMNITNTDLPNHMVVGVTGLGDSEEIVYIELEYVDELDLHFWSFPIELTVEGSAAPPEE